jgi:hypothetical protein
MRFVEVCRKIVETVEHDVPVVYPMVSLIDITFSSQFPFFVRRIFLHWKTPKVKRAKMTLFTFGCASGHFDHLRHFKENQRSMAKNSP